VVERKGMLQTVADRYLADVQKRCKKKTFQKYSVALRYFIEAVGNKELSSVTRTDLLDYSVYLREEKEQGDRSTYNNFENVMTFLKHHDIRGSDLRIKARDWPDYVSFLGHPLWGTDKKMTESGEQELREFMRLKNHSHGLKNQHLG
jgi:hypothetical protein